MSMETIKQGAALLTIPPALLFPVCYGLLVPFWRTDVGRSLFALGSAVALLYGWFLLGLMFPSQEWLVALVAVVLMVAIWYLFLTMLRRAIRSRLTYRRLRRQLATQKAAQEHAERG